MTITAQPPVLASAVARVWHDRVGVVGGAFVVGPDLVATCAHVVAEAVDADPYAPEAPTATVRLDFPLAGDGADGPVDAVVVRWSPIREDGSGDVALLRLAGPAPARVPPVRRIARLWGHGFRVLGFPEGGASGVWTSGRIRGEQGTRWFQLHTDAGEPRVEPGFSGTPVWDSASGAVVGMTVAAIRGDATTAAYLIPIEAVFALDQGLVPCPYPGARPFDAEHSAYFHGRDDDVERLVEATSRLPLVAVAGPSGVGKSSLVRAGLLPRLRARGTPVVEWRLDADPVGSLVSALADAAPGTVVVLDQFEELATLAPQTAGALLDELTARTSTGRVRAVLTLRWAALERLDPRLTAALDAATVLVTPLDRAGLREAIVGPAEHAPGLTFEAGLVDRILDDAGTEPGQLPLVAALLADLWDHREDGRATLRGYLECGGVAGALAQHADRVVDSLDADGATLRRLFTALAEPGRDERFVRRPVLLRDLPPEQRALAEALADRRLLVVTRDTVELAHQALIEHWPRLRDWLTADREFLSWLTGLQERRRRWEADGRDDGALLRGAPLAAAVDWVGSRADDLTPADQDYVRLGVALQRRRMRRRRVVTAVLAVLLLVIGSLSVVAVQRRDVLAGQLATANAGVMGREALARAPSDPALAAQLALAAWRADPGHPAARDALARAYVGLHNAEAEFAALSPEPIEGMVVRGDTALLHTAPHLVVLTGVSGPAPQRRELTDLPPGSGTPVLSPDGRLLAVTMTDRPVVLLRDLTGQQPDRELPGTPGTSLSLPVFAPGGGLLMWFTISASQAVSMQLWDLRRDVEIPNRLGAIPSDVTSGWPTDDPGRVLLRHGTFGRDGTRLVARSVADGTVVTLPEGTAVAPGGGALIRFERDPGLRSPTAVVVDPPAGEGPTRRLTTSDVNPGLTRLSADGGWFLERPVTGWNGDYQTVQLTSLDTGEVRQVIIPAVPERDAGTGLDQALSGAASLGVVSAGGRTSVLLAQGTSVLRFATEPLPNADESGPLTTDGLGPHMFARYDTGIAMWDRRTGQRLGAVTGLDQRIEGPVYDGDTLWIMTPVPDGWEIGHYEMPTLRRITTFRVPERRPAGGRALLGFNPIDLVADGDHVVISNGGWLSAYDRSTGRPLGAPVRLGSTPAELAHTSAYARVWPRPGHPGQVAVNVPGRIELWEMPSGRLIRTIATLTDKEPVFDPSGSRMAVPNGDRAIEVWDVDQGVQVRPPIALPEQSTHVVAFQPDGYLALRAGPSGREPYRVVFIELTSGRQAGVMRLTGDIGTLNPEDQSVGLRTSYGDRQLNPADLRISANGWRDALCAVIDRPLTPSERALLPPGADPTPPCS
jgi:hypothetical protein